MSTIKTFFRGDSATIGFVFPTDYDLARIEGIKVYIGATEFENTITDNVVKCQLKSDETALISGIEKLNFWLDDSILGLKKIYVGDLKFESTPASENNTSVNDGFDVLVNLTITETAISISNVLYNYFKGEKGDKGDKGDDAVLPDNIVIDANYVHTDNNFTTLLKNAYNSAVEWISTNGTNLLNHLTNTSNPHSTTALQVGAVASNAVITGATKTKVTYDPKGLVTSGADATTADIADSADKRYVTDNESDVLGYSKYLKKTISPSFILGRQIANAVTAHTPASSDFTYHTTTVVECHANSFRISLMNLSTSPCVVSKSSIAVSSIMGADPNDSGVANQDRYTPSTGAWAAITWNGGNASVTLPARLGAGRPSITWSDWINISTIPRTDGGVLPVIMIRNLVPSLSSTNPYTWGSFQAIGAAWKLLANTACHNGRMWTSYYFTGDKITNPLASVTKGDLGYVFLTGFEYAAEKAGITIASNGDSIASGSVNGTTGNMGNGWIWQTVNALRALYPNTPVEYVNGGWESQDTATFYSRVADTISAGTNFDLMVYSPFSPNDGTPTATVIALQKNRLSWLSKQLQAINKGLIISTPFPHSDWTIPQDAFRSSFRNLLISMGYVDIVDVESIGDGASPPRIQSAYTGDGVHPNEVGSAYIATLTTPILKRYIPN